MDLLKGISDKPFRIELTPAEIGFLQACITTAIASQAPANGDWIETALNLKRKLNAQFAAQAGPR